MATGTLFVAPWYTALDNNGDLMSGARLYFYLSETLTPADVYHDADLNDPWIWPPETDENGRCVVYLDPSVGNLRFILTTPQDVQIGPTVDPVSPTNAGVSTIGEVFVFCANSTALVTTTTYASGATFDTLEPGSSVWAVSTANLPGTYALEVVGVQNTAGTLTVALVNLTDGAPDTPIATATITSTTGERAVSGSIVFPSSPNPTTKVYGIKAKVSANSGFVIGARITRTA